MSVLLTKADLIDADVAIGHNIAEAVYILVDGTLWDGGFDCGSRGVEHREAEQFSEYDRYAGETFWVDVMMRMGLIMVIPETRVISIYPDHVVTHAQRRQIERAERLGFRVEEFK